MNTVCLIGRLTRDPETRTAAGGSGVCRFTLAVDRRAKDEADFINCVAFGKTAETAGRYLIKGRRAGITGRIQTGKYEKDGRTVYTTDVIVDAFTFCDSPAEHAAENTRQTRPAPERRTPEKSGPFAGFLDIPDGMDEELPFT